MFDFKNATNHEIEIWVHQQEEQEKEQKKYAFKSIQYVRSKVTKKVRERIMNRDNYICQLCGKDNSFNPSDIEIDHKVPVSKDGSSDDENLWTLCHRCNSRKSNRDL